MSTLRAKAPAAAVILVALVAAAAATSFAIFGKPTQAAETLVANREKAFALKADEQKTFYLNLKKGEYAEIFWKDSLDRFPAFSLFTPSGKDLSREVYVLDTMSFVAAEDGSYKLNV